MKKVLTFIIAALLFQCIQPVFAAENSQITDIEYFDDGSYSITVIEDVETPGINLLSDTKTETKTKTSYHKNAAGQTMWYVRVTGTFTYNGTTSKCTSATPSAKSQNENWTVSDISGGKSENKAYASATGKHYINNKLSSSTRKTVTLTCSPTGQFS